MKKYLAMLLAVCMVLGLAACSNQGSGDAGTDSPAPATESTTPAATDEGGETGGTQDIRLASHNAVIEGNPYRVR